MLDPFGGSGTTLAVAKKLKRRFVGFELSADYVAKVEKRLASVRPGDPLEGAAEPLASAPSTANGRALKELSNAEAPKRAGSSRGRSKVKGQRTLPGLTDEGR